MRELMFALLAIGAVSPSHAADKSGTLSVQSADGVPIAYQVYGQGEPALVLVRGWSCDRSYWKEQIEYLSPQFRLVLVDLAGHGQSGTGRKDYTMSAFGADVAAVVDSLSLRKVVLVGHSMGGDVVKAFVLPDSAHFPMLEDPPRFNRSLDSVIKRFQQ